MASERSVTPEKQLLRLIEDPKLKETNVQTQVIKRRSLSFFSGEIWMSRYSFFKERINHWITQGKSWQLDIKFVNKVLVFTVVTLTCYSIFSFFVSMAHFKKKMSHVLSQIKEGQSASNPAELTRLKVASYYLEKARSRDIFKMGRKIEQSEVKEITPADVPSPPKINEATQYLRLVGISWSNDPDAIIEDTKAYRTFFVKRGQMIDGVRVQAILKDRVVLSYEGEEIELQ